MKFTKSSRILAIVLAVVMILPLISVMAFAEGEGDAVSNVIYSADFEGYTLTDGKYSMDAADATFVGAPNAAAGSNNCQWNETKEKFDSSGNFVVADPTLAAGAEVTNKVYAQDINKNLDNNNLRLKVGAISYKDVPNLVFSYRVYIPSDTVGKYQVQAWVASSTAGTVNWCYNHFIDFNNKQAVIDFNNAQCGTIAVISKESVKIARDTWTTVTWALDMVTGDYTWYLNGNKAAVGNFDKGNIEFAADRWHVFKPLKSNNDKSTYKGNIYFDDISLVKGEYEPETLWATDYSAYAVGAAAAQDTNFAANPNNGKTTAMHTIVADPKVEGGKVLGVNNYAGKASKAEADNNWDNNNGKYAVPEISYTKYQAVTFGFDIYIPKDARGQIHWQWGCKGQELATGADIASNSWNDIIYIYQVPEEEFATLAAVGKQNIDDKNDKAMKLPKEEWVRIEWSIDLVSGETNLTVNGVQAWRGQHSSNGKAAKNITLNANALIYAKLLKDASAKDGSNKGITLFKNESVTVGKNVRNEIVIKYPEGTYYLQDFQGFKAEQAIDKGTDAGFIADSKVTEAHKAFADPKKADNIVWWRPLDDQQGKFDDPWAKLGNDRVDYMNTPVVDLTTDYYLPKESTGYFQVQLYGSASGTANYFHLWDINVTDGLLMEHYDGTAPFKAKAEGEDAFKLPRDEWFTIRTIIDLPSGKYDVFLNGKWVAAGHIRNGDSKIVISSNNLDVSCLRCSDGNKTAYKETEPTYVQSGYVLIDNIQLSVFNGSVIKVTADGLADGVLGTKVDDKLLEAGVHLFEEAKTATEVAFDKTPYAKLFKSTVGEFRLNADEGIRFVTELDAALLTQLLADENTSEALVKKGTIILPADYVKEDVALTVDALTAAGIEFLNVVYADAATEYEANKMAGSIYKIKTANYDRDFVAVPYIQVTLPHGNTMTLYGEASAPANAAELAAAALADTTATFNGTEKALLEEYAAKVSAE